MALEMTCTSVNHPFSDLPIFPLFTICSQILFLLDFSLLAQFQQGNAWLYQ